MKEQWIAAGLPTDSVVFEEYNGKSVEAILKTYPGNVSKGSTSIYFCKGGFGFSAGGQQIWGYQGSANMGFVGLIDPSTSKDNIKELSYDGEITIGTNAKIMFNPTNWTGKYKPIGDRLLTLKKWKTDKKTKFIRESDRNNLIPVNDKHIDIPLKFFKKYKDLIENAKLG